MTDLVDTKILEDGRYAWLVWAYEATEQYPVRHNEWRVEIEKSEHRVFKSKNEAKQYFDEIK